MLVEGNSVAGDEYVEDLGVYSIINISGFRRPDVSIIAVSENTDCTFAEKTLLFSKKCNGNLHDEIATAMPITLGDNCTINTLSCAGATISNEFLACVNVPSKDVWAVIDRTLNPAKRIKFKSDENTNILVYGINDDGSLSSALLCSNSNVEFEISFTTTNYKKLAIRLWRRSDPEGIVGFCAYDSYANPVPTNGLYGSCGKVTGLRQTSSTSSTCTVSWNNVPGATEYWIIAKNAAGTEVLNTKTTSISAAFTATSSTAITYDVRVDAKVDGFYIGTPERVVITTSATYACGRVMPPTVSVNGSSATVTWPAVTGSIGYEVNVYPYYANDPDVVNPAVQNTGSSTRTATFSGLTNVSDYRVVVKNKCSSTVTPLSPASVNANFTIGTHSPATLFLSSRGTKYLRLSVDNQFGPLRYRRSGTNAWTITSIETARDIVLVPNLQSGTEYEFQWQPHRTCNDFMATWSSSYYFSTLTSRPDLAVKIVAVNNGFNARVGDTKSYKAVFTNVGNDNTSTITSYTGWKSTSRQLIGGGTIEPRGSLQTITVPALSAGSSYDVVLDIVVNDANAPYLVVQTDPSSDTGNDWKSDLITFAPNNVCSGVSFPNTATVTVDTCEYVARINVSTSNVVVWGSGTTSNTETVETNGSYPFTMMASSGCQASSSVSISSLPARPKTSVWIGNSADDCDSIRLQGSVFPDTARVKYMWSNGVSTREFLPKSSGVYTVSVTDMYGCVVKDSLPVVPFQILKGSKDTMSQRVVAKGGFSPYTFLWSNQDTTSKIPVGANGYTVTITDDNGCDWSGLFLRDVVLALDTTTKKRDSIVVNDIQYAKKLEVYPNPTSGRFKIRLGTKDYGVIELFDMRGRVMFSQKIERGDEELDFTEIPMGMYIVRFTNSANYFVVMTRLVIAR